jgi:CRP/FNR family transcriptional regulator
MNVPFSTLRGLRLFAELEDEDLERLAGIGRIVVLRKKELLFAEGEAYRGPFVVLSGLVVVFKLADDGRMLILHVCRPGDSLAEPPMFEGRDAAFPTHARATRDSQILHLPRDRFEPFLKQHPELAWELLGVFASRLKEMAQQLEGVTLREVTSRLARYLLREMEAAGVAGDASPAVTLQLAKSSLASYLGTVHETLSRTFSRLIRQGIVRVDGPVVTIVDVVKLKRLA